MGKITQILKAAYVVLRLEAETVIKFSEIHYEIKCKMGDPCVQEIQLNFRSFQRLECTYMSNAENSNPNEVTHSRDLLL